MIALLFPGQGAQQVLAVAQPVSGVERFVYGGGISNEFQCGGLVLAGEAALGQQVVALHQGGLTS